MERRNGERRLTVVAGGRGRGPGMVTVLRGQLVEHHCDDQVDWHEVAEAAKVSGDVTRLTLEGHPGGHCTAIADVLVPGRWRALADRVEVTRPSAIEALEALAKKVAAA